MDKSFIILYCSSKVTAARKPVRGRKKGSKNRVGVTKPAVSTSPPTTPAISQSSATPGFRQAEVMADGGKSKSRTFTVSDLDEVTFQRSYLEY